ncbi:hypothetical protein CHLNCDRAFT_133932 [Chlorella variabilis]|uniref:SEC7 domain-containing protein n=1 Tax=Chlorella variabilis TaxID=554065 RepID=E1ZEL7_CHLVA|nr:hypothetical protein CHLNCDRAFT_133932 [Chlorella variabilis]EFN55517.1 hypothetical protein CHLNCDRAFT_133932 [Chlorella variabilis]|eukprot:XP_005847619.1 hypothetical protein CHLNCDRAFT_133932 [Chlorella variabilis]
MASARSPALFLSGEAAAVIAALRSNTKFNRYADDEVEDPLLEEFKALRRKLFSWRNWEEVDPLEYLTPFLETIKSPETSGPITLVALASLDRIIRRGILSASGGGSAAEAIQAVADGVTQCKFEATYPASDECVLHKILDVLVGCVGCPAGALLTNDNLINIFQACYRIGHFQTEKGRDTSELLTQASRQAMAELVFQIFSRLDTIPEPLDSPFATAASVTAHTAPRLHVSPVPSTAMNAMAGGEEGSEEAGGEAGAAQEAADAAATAAPAADGSAGAEAATASEGFGGAAAAAGAADGGADDNAAAAAAAADALGQQTPAAAPPSPRSPLTGGEIVSLLPALQGSPTEVEGYGVEAVREVLIFIISLIGAAPVGAHQDLPAHGLDLMSTALQAAGPALEAHESLMVLLQQDLVRAMFAAAKQPSLACLAGICQLLPLPLNPADSGGTAPLSDPPAFLDIWSPLACGAYPPLDAMLGGGGGGGPAEAARVEKYLKGRLAAAAEHFNRDQKKGFQYLQSLRLLPPQLDPPTVARFLRCCPGLGKASIGEILGERDAFYEEVRQAFMETFDFVGMDFDLALRMFMDSFRPPGEGQKIDRIMQVDEQLVDLWLTSVGVLAKSLCKDECQPLRDNALMVLSRALVSSERLNLPPELWVQTLRELLVPVASDLARLAVKKSRSHPGAEKSVRLAVSMLVKTVLQYIEVVQGDKDFYGLWQAVLQALQDCMAVRHEAVQESVPENAKNMLLVLASSGILTPDWHDAGGRSLWDLTFSRVHTISSGLNPSLLEATLTKWRIRPSSRRRPQQARLARTRRRQAAARRQARTRRRPASGQASAAAAGALVAEAAPAQAAEGEEGEHSDEAQAEHSSSTCKQS